MNVSIIGTHGIPARHGGFETFAEHLAQACAKAGIKVKVINQKNNPVLPCPENVEIVTSSHKKSSSPLKFYYDSLKLAAPDSDIILSCGVGGAFFYSGISMFPVKIVTHLDGLEHKRKKYSYLQRFIIYLLQNIATKKSEILIADSQEVWGYWKKRFPRHTKKIKVISYGADDCMLFSPKVLSDYRLKKDEYFLVIARLVPENNLEAVINSFNHYIGRKKLVIIGALDNTSYVKRLKKIASENVKFMGAIYDVNILDSLRQGCFIYIHGHSVGGTNPSLLEAMAAGCACLCHNNVFNVEVTEGKQIYFNSTYDLSILLNLLEHKSNDIEALKIKSLERVQQEYKWDRICSSYIELFKRLHSTKERRSVSEKNRNGNI